MLSRGSARSQFPWVSRFKVWQNIVIGVAKGSQVGNDLEAKRKLPHVHLFLSSVNPSSTCFLCLASPRPPQLPAGGAAARLRKVEEVWPGAGGVAGPQPALGPHGGGGNVERPSHWFGEGEGLGKGEGGGGGWGGGW